MSPDLSSLLYLIASVCFIMALKGLSSPESARGGNLFGIVGMVIAVVTTLWLSHLGWPLVVTAMLVGGAIGTFISVRLQMTSLPQLIAAFHSLVGLAAVLVAGAALFKPEVFQIAEGSGIKVSSIVEMSVGTAIGAITFTGSIIAFAKLQGIMKGDPITFKGQHLLNLLLLLGIVALVAWFAMVGSADAIAAQKIFILVALASFILGFTLIIPIGGADMPVVISMLNSYSGWAACGIGFTLNNPLLIITGALVGSSGAILSYVMCKAMNRSLFNVILGGFGGGAAAASGPAAEKKPVKIGSAEDAAFILKNASSVVIVPGYGMAVAQAQHVVRELADTLKKEGVGVRYAIHPVAGRMPGHMNVLLAEANVPYEDVVELDEINRDFAQTDVAYIIGANDITNPSAKDDPKSPIFGMPVLDVEKAKTVFFVKRSMASGYAGIDNPLFYRDNTMMLLGDAKKVTEELVKAMSGGGH
ncbi:MAG: NAD(P)(+) transhydrogenase (Re/Si-specific) subunit beta [Spirochaetes bacterium]|nr:NAD(P)(+) transhydrogenase (Re/Si-specific) subunit beta [Spirochaetota bacterium]